MLKPDSETNQYPKMSDQQRQAFLHAVAEEQAAKPENVAAARPVAKQLNRERLASAELMTTLRSAREAAGVSLREMEERTGMRKSALSRLENSQAPNPTLSTLQRYASAVGKRLTIAIEDDGEP